MGQHPPQHASLRSEWCVRLSEDSQFWIEGLRDGWPRADGLASAYLVSGCLALKFLAHCLPLKGRFPSLICLKAPGLLVVLKKGRVWADLAAVFAPQISQAKSQSLICLRTPDGLENQKRDRMRADLAVVFENQKKNPMQIDLAAVSAPQKSQGKRSSLICLRTPDGLEGLEKNRMRVDLAVVLAP